MKYQILLADDEATFRETFATVLREEGMSVKTVANGTEAIEAINTQTFEIAILDIQMPGADGIKVLQEVMKKQADTKVIMITAYGSVEMAVEAIKLGASDYVMKPVMFDDMLVKIRKQLQFKVLEIENQKLKNQLYENFSIDNIIGQSSSMQIVFETIRKVSQTKSNILIIGESGTGKELVARAIHSMGESQCGRFVGINCSAIPEQLLESELFGHKKGSFTSADSDKKGLFMVADGGTLFLDEIGQMPLSCQVKLLRAIEERQILPVGATEPVDFDLQLIAALNKDPLDEIKENRFREDLYYRLNVVGICLPPLRQRRDDIPLLVEHFIKKYNAQMGKNLQGLTDEAMHILMCYEWKGNIRELQNVIERAIIFAETNLITPDDIGLVGPAIVSFSRENENLQQFLNSCEKDHIFRILNKYKCNKADTAKVLGIGLSSLYRKIDQLEISINNSNGRENKNNSDKGTIEINENGSRKLSAG